MKDIFATFSTFFEKSGKDGLHVGALFFTNAIDMTFLLHEPCTPKL